MSPSELSRELREGQSPELSKRRIVFGLSMLGIVVAQSVSLYQLGIIKSLPDPPIGPFDSNKVNASDYAYKRGQTPDGGLKTDRAKLHLMLCRKSDCQISEANDCILL